ncbi:tyrosine-type recombinase/integrase [Haloarcula pelagica]|uniref:tyrosine-type recombinase/integrase n=1 Tax=Haloarcula pelagica TaxID=3033389 RepID=UPI0024C23655|nr:tyrosine-type recombinase/integrase [Halomicroarcula sp. YJ-61-S]
MPTGNSGGTRPLPDALDEFVDGKSPNYAANLERVVGKWIDWCRDRDVHTLDDVEVQTMARYADHLTRRVRAGQADGDDGIAASSAWTYYSQISAFLSWATKWEYIPENPADKGRAKDQLPPRPSGNEAERQFWQPEQRQALLTYLDERAREAVDSEGLDAVDPVRDRALGAVLAYTGVRGAEILADRHDPRRTGITWGDVDLAAGTITVLGKNQEIEPTPLPEQASRPLGRLKRLLSPPDDDWPVFPSRHTPTLYETIEAAGYDRPADDPWTFLLDNGIEPPSLTTSGARSLLKRWSTEADIPGLDVADGEYLTLHGARRGVGEKLYRERGAAAAQRTLRHADPSTTSQMYSHIEASELAEDNTDVFDGE